MTTQTAPALPDLPADLTGWRWSTNAKTGQYFLMHPTSGSTYTTKHYHDPAHAIAEAQRWVISQPKPTPHAGQAPDLEQAIATLRQNGYTVKAHGARYLVNAPGGDPTPMTERQVLDQASLNAWLDGASKPIEQQPTVARPGSGRAGEAIDRAIRSGDTEALVQIAPEAPLITVEQLDALPPDNFPLVDLLGALDDHAKQLPKPLPTDYPIPLPTGLAARLSAPLDMVRPGRYQPRTTFDQTELEELAESIREHGIIERLLVFANERGELELIAGERRLRAASMANHMFVPVEIRSYTLRQIAEISGLDNIQRAQLTPVEEGRYFNRLIEELAISEAELARRLGKNRAYIQQRRAIAGAAPEVVTALDEGQLTFSQARAIAQAAPGDAKAQKQALTKIGGWQKGGRNVSEAEAKTETEKIVRARLMGDLGKLGWSVTSDGEIWSDSQRPTKWTGAEMLAAVEQQRRPGGLVPAGTPDAEAMQTIGLKYQRVIRDCVPWVGLASSWGQAATYYAPDELPDVASAIQTELAALRARAAAHGWQIEAERKAHYSEIALIGPEGGRLSTYYWSTLIERIEQIESGTLVDRPKSEDRPGGVVTERDANGGFMPKQKCDQCGGTAPQYEWHNNKRLCAGCIAPIRAAEQARKAAALAKIDGAIGEWLRAAPAGAIPLLIATLGMGDRPLDSFDVEWVLGQVAEAIVELEDGDLDDAPNVARLLGMGQAADSAGEAGVPPGSRSDAPAQIPDIADGSPLSEIHTAVIAVNVAISLHGGMDAEEIAVNLAELKAASDAMDGLADHPDVSDSEFYDLNHAIGELATLLRERLEAKQVGV